MPDLVRPNLIEDLPIAADRYIGLDDGQSTMIGGVKITAIPAAHELLDRDEATGRYPYLGYILEYNGMALYHSGDTCIYEGMQDKLRQWTLDAALLPINGRDAERFKRNCIGNMTYQEAVDLAGAIRPRLTIPTHFDMFANNSENPQLFLDYIAAKYPKIKARMANYGECLIVKKAGE
ncbi:MAG: metal-dependent hydrolase [candidate division BRC1 bacterium ADurb.BinA364]|nr:MAG: metal-dependent hydrolase [candidate division BRC1 bacterium ADurb.BinA364]